MARIKVVETGEFIEASLFIGGEDIVTCMLEEEFGSDTDLIGTDWIDTDCMGTYYVMGQSDAYWWEHWAETEAKIIAARESATDEQTTEDCRLIDCYGYDLEMLQDAECELFGIDC